MAKTGEKYEAVIVFSLKNGEDAVKALVEKFSNLIKEHAALVDIDEWGKRKLAYEINYEADGYYVVYHFDGKPEFPDELERVLNITDGILRYLVVLRK
ncbi:MAG: 30S ribosomal protein S6 [Ruminiclostridium sp.]|nr:30S ribosomal protein S6 [Ruminiclostridium sp.]